MLSLEVQEQLNICQLESPGKFVRIKTISCIVIFNKTRMRYDSISLSEEQNLFLETMEAHNWSIMIMESVVFFIRKCHFDKADIFWMELIIGILNPPDLVTSQY
jgi:hypothetical protein